MSVSPIRAHQALPSSRCYRRVSISCIMGFAVAVAGCAGTTSTASTGTTTVTPTAPAVIPAKIALAGSAQTRLGATAQITATVTGGATKAVTWLVNGVASGTTASGKISVTGLYTAPAILPSPNIVTISATNPAAVSPGILMETLLNPVPSITTATATEVASSTTYSLVVNGAGFVSGAQIEIAGVAVATTTFVSANQLTASITVAAGTNSLAISVVNPTSGNTPSATTTAQVLRTLPTLATATAAARLLDQATFGPTMADIGHVALIGLDAYLTEQFNTAPTLLADIPGTPTGACTVEDIVPCEQSEWWKAALTGPDQLRQRVAFALSEIFVVSSAALSARAVTPYQNMLVRDAFGNFSTLMTDVTLSTAMGGYLNMLNSRKPGNGQIANENYARELMQLFTTGIDLLNPDGTLQLDANGQPIPVYSQAQVQAFARAYTGWTYAPYQGGASTFPDTDQNYDAPMAAVEADHDTTAKTLLNGAVLPSGQSAEQDLSGALANIFNHPNVAPFVCRQLIQHLVASNPSPAYVARISAVFVNNGEGVRGDMKAVIRAILEDPEARAGDTNAGLDGGHLREAMLYITGALRALGSTNISTVGDYSTLSGFTSALGEEPYSAGSVFNFFPPNYVIPGTTDNAPEFGVENTATAILRLTLADKIANNKISHFNTNLDAGSSLGVIASKTGVALTDSTNLVNALGNVLMHGQMPSPMHTAIINHVATLTDPAERVRVAIYLIITASQYKIEN